MLENEALGIDLGGTQIKCVVLSNTGEILHRAVFPTADDDAQSWLHVIRNITRDLGQNRLFGLSAPGLVAANGRSIAHLPGRLHGLQHLDWTTVLGRATPVPIWNDAQASLLGEAWLGAARSFAHVIMITLGTGVGGAIIADGRLLRGHLGRAGHLGHVTLDVHGTPSIVGAPGALETMMGNYNIHERTGGRFQTTHQMIAAFRRGEVFATDIWLKSIHALACGLTSFINILDPEAIIIGGGIAQAGDDLFVPLAKALDGIEWRPAGQSVAVLPAMLGEWAGAIGAARAAFAGFGGDPMKYPPPAEA